MRGLRIHMRGFCIHLRGCISCGVHILRGFYGVEVAIPAPISGLYVKPALVLEASNNGLNATLRHARLAANPSDAGPAFTFVIGVVCNSQKHKPFGLLFRSGFPDL